MSEPESSMRHCRYCGGELSDFDPWEYCRAHEWMRWYGSRQAARAAA